MNHQEIAFFVSEATRHGRSLPFSDAVRFFRGFVYTTEGRIPAEAEDVLRASTLRMNECDEQLELIASAQMKIAFPPPLAIQSTPRSAPNIFTEAYREVTTIKPPAKRKGARH